MTLLARLALSIVCIILAALWIGVILAGLGLLWAMTQVRRLTSQPGRAA